MLFSFVKNADILRSALYFCVKHAMSEVIEEPSFKEFGALGTHVRAFSCQDTVVKRTFHSNVVSFVIFDSLHAFRKQACLLKLLAIGLEYLQYMLRCIVPLHVRNGWGLVLRDNLLLRFLDLLCCWLVLRLFKEFDVYLEVAFGVGWLAHHCLEVGLGADDRFFVFVHARDLEATLFQFKSIFGLFLKALEISRRELGDLIAECRLECVVLFSCRLGGRHR